jgi:hypothetical protein
LVATAPPQTDRFVQPLVVTVELAIKGDRFSVAGAMVKSFRFELASHGWHGALTFWVTGSTDTDELLEKFLTQDLTEATISIDQRAEGTAPPAPLVLKGLVTDKELREVTFGGVKGDPVLVREYTIHARDAAGVLWRQHFPIVLKTGTSMSDLIGEHLATGITVDAGDLGDAGDAKPMITLPLGEGDASFYDTLAWYVDSVGGQLYHDYASAKLVLADAKPSLDEIAILPEDALAETRVVIPETGRQAARVLNAHAEAPIATIPVPSTTAASGIHHDRLVRTPIVAEVAVATAAEAARLARKQAETIVRLARLVPAAVQPGNGIKLAKTPAVRATVPSGVVHRVASAIIEADAVEADPDRAGAPDFRVYLVRAEATWERADDPACRMPAFVAPRFPLYVEGKIISDGGKTGDRTYMTFEDPSAQSFYKVQLPLFNEKVNAPFTPFGTAGQIYAPGFKDSRVLVALWFDRAEIIQFLDWGADVRLPSDSQGNHWLFGKNKTSQTSLKHVYLDEKPQLTIARSSNGDLQLFQLDEGVVVLQTKEDPSQQAAAAAFDLTSQVAAAREQLESGTQGSIGKVTAAFRKSKGALTGKTNEAKSKTSGALDAMEGELGGKADAAKAELEGALAALDGKAAALKAKANAVVSELKAKTRL